MLSARFYLYPPSEWHYMPWGTVLCMCATVGPIYLQCTEKFLASFHSFILQVLIKHLFSKFSGNEGKYNNILDF